jgi:hypothetical protein
MFGGCELEESGAAQGGAYVTARQYPADSLPVPTYRLGQLAMVGEPLAAAPDAGGRRWCSTQRHHREMVATDRVLTRAH